MKIPKRPWAWMAILVLLCAVALPLAAGAYWTSLEKRNLLPTKGLSEKVWWRARIYVRKASGGVPDLSWSELWQMTNHRGGFGLANLVSEGVSADGSVINEYTTPEDHAAGAMIFRKRCERCHGNEGIGGFGPALNHSGLKHGDSDLAMYKVLRDGIPSTPMVAADLDPVERWEVIGYLRTLMVHYAGQDAEKRFHLNINVSSDQILSAGSRSDEWLTYSGSLDGHRYTPLSEINTANVSKLRIHWIQQFDNSDPTVEATPLVVGGTMFITEPPSNVVALDAKSGEVIWRYDRKVASDVWLCCGRFNRGVAILGNTLFLGALDGYLVAINANTGKMIWETRVADGGDGYSVSGAPLIVNHSVVVGVAGGEYGIRGFLAAYDPVTGELQWKFNTIPDPGAPGHETWKGGGWQTGGAPTWITGSYDPSLDLLYWGTGNPAPDYLGTNRPGDNLFTDSAIALHPRTGKLAWYFQFTPHDEHDWDSNQTPVLTDVAIGGTTRKVISWANRNGFYYVLDRVTGEFLTGVPFVEQTWAKGLDPKGRPILTDANEISSAGRLTRPAQSGGTNWENTALDQRKGLIFVPATEGAAVFTNPPNVNPIDMNRKRFLGSFASNPEVPTAVVRALDIATGAKKWEHLSPPLKSFEDLHYYYSGLLATGGDLVFGASGGYVFALDSTTGHELWRVFLGGDTRAAPISFTVDGQQVIAVSAGRSLFVLGL